jgi:hypothetical protein
VKEDAMAAAPGFEKTHDRRSRLGSPDRLIEAALCAVLVLLAAGTAAYQLVFVCGWPVAVVPILWAVFVLVAGAAVARLWRLDPAPAAEASERPATWRHLAAVAAIGLAAAGYTLLVNRPDSDGEYLRRVLVQMDRLGEPVIASNVTYDLNVPDVALTQYLASYEMLLGVIGTAVGADPVNLYFNLFAAGAALLWALIYFGFYRAFGLSPGWAATATLGAAIFLVLDGNSHTSPGNWAFVRLWQGKSLVITLGVPWAIWLTYRFLQSPTANKWLMPSAVWVTAAACVLAADPACGRDARQRAGRSGLALAATAYPMGVGLIVYATGYGAEGVRATLKFMFAEALQGGPAWVKCLGHIASPSALVCYAAILLAAPWLVLPPRRALAVNGIALVAVASFFNPLMGPPVQRIFGPVYSRLFYVLPVAFCFGLAFARAACPSTRLRGVLTAAAVVGMVWAAQSHRIAESFQSSAATAALAAAAVGALGAAVWARLAAPLRRRAWLSAASLGVLACLFAVQSRSATFSASNRAEPKALWDYRFARPVREFLAAACPHMESRTVLAPREIALAAEVTNRKARFLITWDLYTRWSLGVAGLLARYPERAAAQAAVAGAPSAAGFSSLEELVLRRSMDAVVVGPGADEEAVRQSLRVAGDRWDCAAEAGGYRLYVLCAKSAQAAGRAAGETAAQTDAATRSASLAEQRWADCGQVH